MGTESSTASINSLSMRGSSGATSTTDGVKPRYTLASFGMDCTTGMAFTLRKIPTTKAFSSRDCRMVRASASKGQR